jgi:type IV secretory pathway VirB2 component (pilin)
VSLIVIVPAVAFAQSGGTPFDTGFTALQNLFTGTIAKVASLIAIVIGGYEFAHGSPGAKNSRFAYVSVSRASVDARIVAILW